MDIATDLNFIGGAVKADKPTGVCRRLRHLIVSPRILLNDIRYSLSTCLACDYNVTTEVTFE